MGSNDTAYFYDKFSTMDLTSTVAQADIDILKKNGHYPNYFIKFYSKTTRNFESFFIQDKSQYDELPCPGHYFIL